MKMVTAEYKSALKHQGAERPLWQAPPAEILDIHRCAIVMTPDEYLGLLVAWRTASRIGDLNAVLNEHLRLERQEASGMYLWTVQFVKTKGDPFMIGQVVPFYLTEEENYMMTRHLASHPPSQKFTPLTTARAQQVLGAVREGLTAHSVKRGALIMMLRRGVPIQMIQWIAKHRDLHTLLIYLPRREVSLALGLHELGGKTCTLDFMVLNEAGTEPVKRRRKVEYRFSIGEQFVRTERPYTVSDARWLLSVIRGFKKTDVPRTKLKALYPILFQSPEVAMFHGQRLKERLKTSGALEKSPPLQTLIDQLGAFPFRMTSESGKESQHYTTPFSELIELYDFIHVDEPQDEDFQQEATDAATQTLPA